ncbi:unnamed protein product [Musa acuminata subsp. burmannicoides]
MSLERVGTTPCVRKQFIERLMMACTSRTQPTPTFAHSCPHILPKGSGGGSLDQTASSSSSSSWWPAMGRSRIRLSCCCRSRAAAPIRLGSPQQKPKTKPKPKLKFVADRGASVAEAAGGDEAKKAAVTGRKIVVAVDSGPEAKAALQWALSHSLHDNDSLVLVSVVKPRRRRKLPSLGFATSIDVLFTSSVYRALAAGDRSQTEWSSRSHQAFLAMQSMCQARRPEIKVELSVVEGRERGPAIVEEARKQGASLLVLGQKKRSIAWRVVRLWSGNSMRGGVVDYCIQNASCMTVAVRRKSRRGGQVLLMWGSKDRSCRHSSHVPVKAHHSSLFVAAAGRWRQAAAIGSHRNLRSR